MTSKINKKGKNDKIEGKAQEWNWWLTKGEH